MAGDLARWRERFERFVRAASIVKVSDEEPPHRLRPGRGPGRVGARLLGAGAARWLC
jgi:hypothetical protein